MDYTAIVPVRNRRLPGTDSEIKPDTCKVYQIRGLKQLAKKRSTKDASWTLPFGRKSGILTIGPYKPIGKARLFATVCDCGRHNLSTADQIWHNLQAGLGCGEDDCHAVALPKKLWREAKESQRLQLIIRIAVEPEDVFSFWGGKLDDGFNLTQAEGVANFINYCQGEMTDERNIWACKDSEKLPFIEGNITMKSSPDPIFYEIPKGE